MAIINKKIGSTTYVCEVKAYRENGKVKHKWKTLGKLDADGNIIPSKKRASAEATSVASLNNSQNSLNSTNVSTNAGTLGTIENNYGSDSGNDAIITTLANVNNVNNVTTTPMPEMSAMSTTATNNPIAATPTTTVTDNVSDTPNIPFMSDESAVPVAMSTAKTKPVADNISYDYYDAFAETPVEASIAASNDEPIASSEAYEAHKTHGTHKASNEAFTNTDKPNYANCGDKTTYGTAIPDTTSIDDTNEFILDILTTEASRIHQVPQSPQATAEPVIPTVPVIPTTTDTIASTTVPSNSKVIDGADRAEETVDNLAYADNASWEVQEESSQRNLPQVVSKKPAYFKMGTTKVENTLFDPIKNESIYEATGTNDVKINVSRKNSQKKRIDTLLYIDFNSSKANGVSIAFENRITPYDREIHNTIVTLAAAGNNCITPSMIFQLLSGNISDERNKMSDETRRKILASVDKMRFTSIDINATAEVKAGMITCVRFSGYLIPAERTEVEVNGQIVKDGIKLIKMPPLFQYACLKNQVVTISVKMLDTPLNNTPENIELKAYLLRRILSMSNANNNMKDVIRYNTIYQYLRITAPNSNQVKKKHKNIRDKTKILLDFWKGEKLIKDYKEEREGKTIAKIIIYR